MAMHKYAEPCGCEFNAFDARLITPCETHRTWAHSDKRLTDFPEIEQQVASGLAGIIKLATYYKRMRGE